jgi:uncharacterized protein
VKTLRLSFIALVFLSLGIMGTGCATYQGELQGSLDMIRAHKPEEAAAKLKEKANKDSDDQVVYLFEYATALHLAKDYQASNKAFLLAEDLTSVKDYHSLSRITGSILLNEGMVQYKGEDYEKVYINALLAINFLALNDRESALVEVRKLNDKLYKYKFEAKRDYNQDPFAYYLAASIWEADKKYDDAYIDYKKAYELNPKIDYLKQDLLRLAKLSRRPDDFDKWKKTFNEGKVDDLRTKGEIIGVIEQGWAPRKYPHPDFPRIPKLNPVYSNSQRARLVVDGVGEEDSQVVTSVEQVAIKTLDDQYAGLIAKRAAGIAAKAVVADQIRQKNELLGAVAWIGMNVADRADLRQWVTLPRSFQIIRLPVPQGKYKIHFEGLNFSGTPTGEKSDELTVEVGAGKKVFVPWRALN